jgi:hypothetical protein
MIQCPQCNTNNQPNSRFCSGCGVQFIAHHAAQPVIKETRLTKKHLLTIGGGILFVAILMTFGNKTSDKTAVSSNIAAVASTPIPTATPIPPPTFYDLKAKAESLLALNQNEYEKADLQQFDDAMMPLRAIPKEDKNYKQAQALNKKLIDKVAPIAAEILVLGDKPVNSPYDGRVDAVVEYLKANLNDYDDSEWLEWSPVVKMKVKNEPFWAVRLKLRAKNAFGGKILKDVVFFIRNNQVVSTTGL